MLTGRLVGIALEQRLFAEAVAGCLSSDLSPGVAAPEDLADGNDLAGA